MRVRARSALAKVSPHRADFSRRIRAGSVQPSTDIRLMGRHGLLLPCVDDARLAWMFLTIYAELAGAIMCSTF